ncbi:MAG TPA: ABC transporter permease [Patescibacteria group bacterium]|nr:ABC transporter permease [Patescibacteria group bacterium]
MSITSEAPAAFRNVAATPGPLALIGEAVREVSSRRRLVRYLVGAEVKKRGANTVLGNIWWVLDPLLLMLVYVVLVAIIARRPIDDYPLFIFAAILPWKWFTAAVTDATSSIVSQHRLIKQIAFPKIVLPIAATTAGVVGFAFGMIPLAGIMLLYLDRLSPLILLVPVIAAVQYVFTLGVALVVAAGNVFVRDLGNVMRHLLRLWFYLSPGLYSLSMLDDVPLFDDYPWLHAIVAANPFAILFEAYRSVIYGTVDGPPVAPDWLSLAVLLVISSAFVAVATVLFKRLEPTFAKVL